MLEAKAELAAVLRANILDCDEGVLGYLVASNQIHRKTDLIGA